jgi:PAS domain S-box-containing protein
MNTDVIPEMAKEISCRITRTLLLYVRENNNGRLDGFMDGLALTEDYLLDTNNWVSHAFLQVLYHRMIEQLKDDNAVYNMILAADRYQSFGLLNRIARLLGSPRLIYSQAPRFNRLLKLNGRVFIHEIGATWAVLEDRYHDASQKTRLDCDFTRAVMAGIPTVFGLPMAEVEEINCQVAEEKYGSRRWPDHPHQGSDGCLYRVRWINNQQSIFKRFMGRRKAYRQATEELIQANQLIQAKYDEVRRLASDLEAANRQLVASKRALESQKAVLMESERKYRNLFENGSDLICIHDLEGNLLETNVPFKREYGWMQKDLDGINIRDMIPNKYQPAFDEYLQRVIANGSDEGYLKALTRSGKPVILEYRNKLVRDANGRPKAVHGAARDVTQRIEYEKEKQTLEAKLENARKLESLGTLAGGVAHDLNNILSGITSYPDLLLLDIDADSPLREPLLTIKNSGLKAAEIVQDLLTLARRGVAIKKPLSLNQVIGDFLASPEYRRLVGEASNVDLQTDLGGGIFNILGSAAHISKTVMNLVANAIEAMPAGGRVSMSTRDHYLDQPHVGFEVVPEGEYVVLAVSDTGIGMPAAELSMIFEPFYTKKVLGRSGTGLGMSVVWGTVKDHDGFIDIATQEGSGTRFTLYFPASREEIESPRSIYIEDYFGKGESILIIDDARAQRALTARMMQRLGYAVTTAASGEEAVALINAGSYDLLILDMIMPPGMDGLETYQRIIDIVPDQRAIIASGYAETERVREAQRLGAGSYVKKPFTLEKIGLAVRHELDRSDAPPPGAGTG